MLIPYIVVLGYPCRTGIDGKPILFLPGGRFMFYLRKRLPPVFFSYGTLWFLKRHVFLGSFIHRRRAEVNVLAVPGIANLS